MARHITPEQIAKRLKVMGTEGLKLLANELQLPMSVVDTFKTTKPAEVPTETLEKMASWLFHGRATVEDGHLLVHSAAGPAIPLGAKPALLKCDVPDYGDPAHGKMTMPGAQTTVRGTASAPAASKHDILRAKEREEEELKKSQTLRAKLKNAFKPAPVMTLQEAAKAPRRA